MATLSARRAALREQLAASMRGAIPEGTVRQVPGTVALPGKATVVIGMRRAGKTTFVHQLRRAREQAGTVRSLLPYVNFEDERLVGLDVGDLSFLLDEAERQAQSHAPPGAASTDDPTATNRTLWALDEIQNVVGWERFVRRLLDRGDVDVVVTGSSATLLSREIATALRGRAWTVPLYPFSFAEALRHADPAGLGGARVDAPEPFTRRADRLRIEAAFGEWLRVGGFPEAQALPEPDRLQLLRDYVDVAVLRDVVERHRVTNVLALRWMVRHLLGNAGALFSVEKFHQAIRSQGIAVGKDTVHELLAHLDDCFLVRTVWMESASERQRMVNPRKAYPVDAGLIPVFDRTGRANIGHALETAVLVELQRRRHDVTYVRTATGRKVDFLSRDPEGRPLLIQVCADASDPETADREIAALRDAATAHPAARCMILTATLDGAPPECPESIEVVPAYEWMLTPIA